MSLKEPHKLRIDEEILVDKSLTAHESWHHNDSPFSGYEVQEYHPNRVVKFEVEFREGEKKGWVNLYFENGQLQSSSLRYGYGVYEYFEYDEDGNQIKYYKCVTDEMYNNDMILLNLKD